MAPAIPDRWLDYKPVGEIIQGTRFIAFKVPLRNHVVQSVPADIRLDCGSLLDKIPNLGMIIDLTNTNRYYDPRIFQEDGLVYEKLKIPGHEVPNKIYSERFKMLVNNFLKANANNAKLIGVHCTHGVNRTGYLISKFMISELKMHPQEAIKCVEGARGHVIERQNYIQSLLREVPSRSNSDNEHISSNSILSDNTCHPNNNNRSTMSSNDRDTDNWRVPKSDSNNIAPLEQIPLIGNNDRDRKEYSPQRRSYDRNERFHSYSQQRSSYNRNERDYSPQRSSYERNQRPYPYSPQGSSYNRNERPHTYSRQRSSYDRNEKEYSPQRSSYDRNEKEYSPQRSSYDRNEKEYSPQRSSYDRNEKKYSPQRSSYDRNERAHRYSQQSSSYDRNGRQYSNQRSPYYRNERQYFPLKRCTNDDDNV